MSYKKHKIVKDKFRKNRKLYKVGIYLGYLLLYGCFKLLYRKKIVDPNNYIGTNDGKVIGVAWHNRLMFFPCLLPKHCLEKTWAVISASGDGDFVADLIGFLGVKAIRGSSKKRASKALFEAFNNLKEGYNIVFTPDGPGGPKYSMSKGPIALSSHLQAPIIPLSINASRYWSCRSWDNFQIPKPFSTLTLVVGDAISVPAELDRDGIAEYQEKVRQALMDITVD
ncbi:MAG: lysophospholipid acyltransferase family protein [Lentisphaeria bacterium]|nr:lysophospholipid acyltransferase family protein [Lentisphaeria bacterium]